MIKAELDHLVFAATTLAEAQEVAEMQLGQNLAAGGEHVQFGTHNRLLGLENREYFEAISTNPDTPSPRPRWFGLDRFQGAPRLLTWVCRVTDLDAALKIWPGAGDIIALSRGDLRWRMAVPSDGALLFDGAMPMLIEWDGDLHPSDQLGDQGGCISQLHIASPHAAEVKGVLEMLGFQDLRVSLQHAPDTTLRANIETRNGTRVLS